MSSDNFLKGDLKFETGKIHDTLFMVRAKNSKQVIGYVNYHPQEQYWFWFMLTTVGSYKFSTFQDALESLIQTFFTVKIDSVSKKYHQ